MKQNGGLETSNVMGCEHESVWDYGDPRVANLLAIWPS